MMPLFETILTLMENRDLTEDEVLLYGPYIAKQIIIEKEEFPKIKKLRNSPVFRCLLLISSVMDILKNDNTVSNRNTVSRNMGRILSDGFTGPSMKLYRTTLIKHIQSLLLNAGNSNGTVMESVMTAYAPISTYGPATNDKEFVLENAIRLIDGSDILDKIIQYGKEDDLGIVSYVYESVDNTTLASHYIDLLSRCNLVSSKDHVGIISNAFESLLNTSNQSYTIANFCYDMSIALEEVSISDEDVPSDTISYLLRDIRLHQDIDTASLFDQAVFNNYIALNRNVRTDPYANRYFEDNLERVSVLSTIYGDNNRNIYQLDNNLVIMPFTDMNDYSIKMLVLDIVTGKLYPSENFRELL